MAKWCGQTQRGSRVFTAGPDCTAPGACSRGIIQRGGRNGPASGDLGPTQRGPPSHIPTSPLLGLTRRLTRHGTHELSGFWMLSKPFDTPAPRARLGPSQWPTVGDPLVPRLHGAAWGVGETAGYHWVAFPNSCTSNIYRGQRHVHELPGAPHPLSRDPLPITLTSGNYL